MAAEAKEKAEQGPEPLFAQVSTAELKRILNDRFAREVSSAAWARLLRALTLIGLPAIVAVGGLLWTGLETEVSSKISDQRKDVVAEVTRDADRTIAALRDAMESRVDARVVKAFTEQYGQAVGQQLRVPIAERSFQTEMRTIVRNAVLGAWKEENGSLRRSFLEQLKGNREFLSDFAQQVAGAMAESRTVPGIIAEALEKSVRDARPEDNGRTAALALLAAMDQGKANAAVRHLLKEGAKHGQRDMALQALRHVAFNGLDPPAGEATAMLEAALSMWAAYCAALPCDAEQGPARGIKRFLGRGRELAEPERRAWVSIWACGTRRCCAATGARANSRCTSCRGRSAPSARRTRRRC